MEIWLKKQLFMRSTGILWWPRRELLNCKPTTKVILPSRYRLRTFAKNEGMKKAIRALSRKWLDADSWALLLSAYEKSHLSVKDFCSSQGISAASYYRWQKRLRSDKGTDSTHFSTIEIQGKSTGSIVVELPGGVILRFEELPPVAYLRSLSSMFSDS